MSIATDVAAGIEEAQDVIAEIGESFTLRQISSTLRDPAKPWLGQVDVPTDTSVKGVISGYRERDIDGNLIQRGDLQVIILQSDLDTLVPTTDDMLIWIGTTYSIIASEPVPFNGTNALYILQVRA